MLAYATASNYAGQEVKNRPRLHISLYVVAGIICIILKDQAVYFYRFDLQHNKRL